MSVCLSVTCISWVILWSWTKLTYKILYLPVSHSATHFNEALRLQIYTHTKVRTWKSEHILWFAYPLHTYALFFYCWTGYCCTLYFILWEQYEEFNVALTNLGPDPVCTEVNWKPLFNVNGYWIRSFNFSRCTVLFVYIIVDSYQCIIKQKFKTLISISVLLHYIQKARSTLSGDSLCAKGIMSKPVKTNLHHCTVLMTP